MEQSTVVARFWTKVDRNGPVPEHRHDLGPCWLWTRPLAKSGYAAWDYGGRRNRVRTLAHRFAYEVAYGAIPDGLHIDHLCRRRACVRPAHLEAVTQAENNRRAAAVRPRVTHCPQGHEYTPENTRRQKSGAPGCRRCQADRQHIVRQLKRRPPRTHCPQGHPFSGENVYVDPDGHRECRICRRVNFRAWNEKNRKGASG